MIKDVNKLKGFSLLEVLITIAILLVMTGLVLPTTFQKSQRGKLEAYAKQLTTDLYYQQQRSVYKGITGGIQIQSNGYTIFDGASLATATETQYKDYPDNVHINSVTLSSGNEILFLASEFRPMSYGSLVVTDGVSSARVYINSEGLIEYEIL